MIDINTVYQGDCLDLMQALDDQSIDMILCDLPYGTTKCKWDMIVDLDALWFQYERLIKNHGAIVLTCSQPFTSILVASNLHAFKYSWVWHKHKAANFPCVHYQPLKVHEDIAVFMSGRERYHPQMSEGTFRKKGGYDVDREYAVSAGTPAKYNSSYYPKSILDFSIANNKNSRLHPTQKPLDLFEYLIKTYTNPNDLILDNCAGSGTTAIAAINTDRNFILMEQEPKYVDICNQRIKERLHT